MIFRCPSCRTRRKDFSLFTKHIQESGHKLCQCGGYHYKHRPNSTYCELNKNSILNEAIRRGESEQVLEDIRDYISWNAPGIHSTVCPF